MVGFPLYICITALGVMGVLLLQSSCCPLATRLQDFRQRSFILLATLDPSAGGAGGWTWTCNAEWQPFPKGLWGTRLCVCPRVRWQRSRPLCKSSDRRDQSLSVFLFPLPLGAILGSHKFAPGFGTSLLVLGELMGCAH